MHRHNFIKSDKEGYEVCTDCGTYHSTALLSPDELYQVYWGGEGGTGRSTLEQQVSNLTCNDDCGISKIDRVLQFVPKTGRNFLEIGCAPGELLRQMLERNWDVYGIEPSPNYVEFICKHAPGARVWCGYFPQITKELPDNSFSCIVTLDVFEHVENFNDFIMELRRLLQPNARAIIMSPIIYEDGLIRKTEFIPNEHAYIFTKKFLQEYLSELFSEVKFTRWIVSHEMIILNK